MKHYKRIPYRAVIYKSISSAWIAEFQEYIRFDEEDRAWGYFGRWRRINALPSSLYSSIEEAKKGALSCMMQYLKN